VKVGNEQMPVGDLSGQNKVDERKRLVRILSGKQFKPDGTFEVASDIREDPRWNGPYLDPNPKELVPKNKRDLGQLVDAWGNPLMIRIKRGNFDKMMRFRPDSFEIWSSGPNEINEIIKRGSGDDVANWE